MTAKVARFRFYAELNDFLPEERRFVTFERPFELDASVKDMIESLGVPHTEVDLVVVDGESVDWSHRVADGELISVYPVFESFDISPVIRLRPEPLRDPRFVLDGHLGQLARWLRLLGFDTAYRNHAEDAELAAVSSKDHRILLTRDVGLLKRKSITHGSFVRATDPEKQLVEVVQRWDLNGRVAPFTRCMNCNGRLVPAEKADVIDELEPGTATYYDEFRRCEECGRVYWKGSHYERLLSLIERVLDNG
jgi:uncharacterized protein with PIN domain